MILPTMKKIWSDFATKELGFSVIMFFDGRWICQPNGNQKMGFGDTPKNAITDCSENNLK